MNRRGFLFGLGAATAAVVVPPGMQVASRPAAGIPGPATSGGAPLVRLAQEYDINRDQLIAQASVKRGGRLYYVHQVLPASSERDVMLERQMVQALVAGAGISRPVRVVGSIRSSGDPHPGPDRGPTGRWCLPDSAGGRS